MMRNRDGGTTTGCGFGVFLERIIIECFKSLGNSLKYGGRYVDYATLKRRSHELDLRHEDGAPSSTCLIRRISRQRSAPSARVPIRADRRGRAVVLMPTNDTRFAAEIEARRASLRARRHLRVPRFRFSPSPAPSSCAGSSESRARHLRNPVTAPRVWLVAWRSCARTIDDTSAVEIEARWASL